MAPRSWEKAASDIEFPYAFAKKNPYDGDGGVSLVGPLFSSAGGTASLGIRREGEMEKGSS